MKKPLKNNISTELDFELDHDEVDSEGSWAISYGDMVTLLLSFFILFFNLDPATKAIQQKIKADTAMQSTVLNVFDPTMERTLAKTTAAGEANLDEAVRAADWKGKVFVEGERIIIDFTDISFFNSAQTDVTEAGKKALRQFSEKFLPYAGRHVVSIRAFTDGRAVRHRPGRRFKDNLELSALRSISAMRQMQTAGIPIHLMRIAGHGELLNFNKTERKAAKGKAEAFERRVMLVIEPISNSGATAKLYIDRSAKRMAKAAEVKTPVKAASAPDLFNANPVVDHCAVPGRKILLPETFSTPSPRDRRSRESASRAETGPPEIQGYLGIKS
jgi:flagellar motor protein MotB